MPQADQALHKERESWRVTLASIGDAVVTTDNQGHVAFLNPVAESLTGWSLAEAAGLPLETIFKIVNEETRHDVENPVHRVLREGIVVGLANHTMLIAKDGVERPIDDSGAPIRDAQGQIIGVVLVFRDITERRQAEIALQQSEQRFRLLVEGARDYAIFMLDPQGHIVSWNPGAQQIKGYLAHEIIGKHFSVFYPREAIAARWPEQELEMATAQGRFEDEGWRLRKDGTKFWANVVITALRNESGQLIGFSKITRDLTERRRAEANLRDSEVRYRRLFEAARDGILILDAENGRIIDVNPFMTALLGYSRDELLGKEVWQISPPQDAEANKRAYRRVLEQDQVRYDDLPLQTKAGDAVEVEFVSNVYAVDSSKVVQCNIRDIRQRRELERARVQAELMADLNRRKDQFLAMLSHELRNPLSPILNAVRLLELDHGDPATQQQARTIVARQVAHLKRLIDDLLEVSRITTGKIQLQRQPMDLQKVVEHAVETVRPLVHLRKHELTLSTASAPIWLNADATRLEQVIVNLLTNAAKYTHEGGKLSLSLERAADVVVLRVRDNGIGIAADLLPGVFALFTQGERSLARSEGGLGVGLTVVRQVVENHGGKVEAHSPGPGQGSEFVVRLPIVASPEAQSSTGEPSGNQQGRLRLLVVDDNQDAADTTAMLLEVLGHQCSVAYSGAAGLDAALADPPDAVILDIGLPGMDGYEVAKRLRQDNRTNNVPLIALTGYGRDVDRELSQSAGFDVHIVKPVDMQKLQQVVASIAQRRTGNR